MSTPQSAGLPSTWTLIKPYWVSAEKSRGWLLLATIVGLTLGQVYISVLLNTWNASFYNALQDKNFPEFIHQLVIFTLIAAAYIAAAVYRQYFNQMLQIKWREWMTERYQNLWLAHQSYYRLQVIYKSTDNPDQRIADDIDGFTSSTLSLGIGLLSSIVTLASFVSILWGLSGAFTFVVANHTFVIPGYMLWAAIIYSIVGTWITHLIGRRLVQLNFDQQRFEANFRFSMVRVRENAESIAFYKGEAVERNSLRDRFGSILTNWWQIMRKQKQLTWFTTGFSQIATIFPIVVAAPRYFSGAIQLGGLMQTASAFGRVQESLSWLVDIYPQYANWKATTERLGGFTDAIETATRDNQNKTISLTKNKTNSLIVEDLSLSLPNGASLVKNLSVTLEAGDHLLIQGAPGSGKTTFLRALAGMWPYGEGRISISDDSKILFIPQKSYLPILPLRDALCYPNDGASYSDTLIQESLEAVGLPALKSRLSETENWAQSLSPGEQQKVSFARIIIDQPTLLFLDEATSSVDTTSETQLHALISSRLPQTIVVSIGHNNSLATWHNKYIQIP